MLNENDHRFKSRGRRWGLYLARSQSGWVSASSLVHSSIAITRLLRATLDCSGSNKIVAAVVRSHNGDNVRFDHSFKPHNLDGRTTRQQIALTAVLYQCIYRVHNGVPHKALSAGLRWLAGVEGVEMMEPVRAIGHNYSNRSSLLSRRNTGEGEHDCSQGATSLNAIRDLGI